MSDFWVDVYEVGGGADVYPDTRVGAGPITNIIEWESTATLDGVGSFSFAMPASDPKAAYLANRRVVWCWRRDYKGAPVFVGAGIVTRITHEVTLDGPTLLRVSGPDLLQELAERTTGQLNILEHGYVYLTPPNGAVRALYGSIDIDLPAAHDGLTTVASGLVDICTGDNDVRGYLYIGYDARFSRVKFDLAQANTVGDATLWYQYYNENGQWVDLDVTSDTTFDPVFHTVAFYQDGELTFTRPADWARVAPTVLSGSWFWIRITRATGVNFQISLNEVTAYADIPTLTGVQLIMANANTAVWGPAAAYPLTTAPHYVRFDGESVLTALITLTERGGQQP